MREHPFSKAESVSPDGWRLGAPLSADKEVYPVKKKLCEPLCVFLSAVLLIGLLNFPAGAAGILAGGECGDSGNNVTWTLDRDGLLTVSGTGAMYDYASKEDVPWYAYREQVKKVEVQNGVTTVGQNAFRDCTALESVTLPAQGLTNIKNVAFYECNALKEMTIPEGVETIGESAFGFCGLTTISIPASVTSIGESVFYRCSSLTAIDVNAANENYSSENGILFNKVQTETPGGESGESGNSGGESGESGGNGGSSVSNKTLLIWYPAAKTEEEYIVPSGVKTIGSYAFHSAPNLKKATLPNGLEVIQPYAFSYSALGYIDLPASLTTIGEYAFYECRGLSTTAEDNTIQAVGTVHFRGSRPQWTALKVGDKNYCLTNANIEFEDMKQDNVVASGECGALGSNASWSLSDKGDFLISGTGAMSNYKSASGVPWASYRASADAEAQDLREQILKVTIEGDIMEDGVVKKTGITNVGDYAFYDCVNLESVTLPPTITTVGAQTFSDCAKLTSVNLSDTKATAIGDYAFNGTTALHSVILPETLRTIGRRAFMRSGLTEVTIPASVTSIGEWAFRWCGSLASFKMEPLTGNAAPHPSAVIGDYALANCAALTNVDFTQNLASLGEYALADCVTLVGVSDKSLQEGVWIPASVSNIGSCAFHGCAALKAVHVEEDNITYSSASGTLMNKDETCIYYYPAGRPEESCLIAQSVSSVVPFAFDGANNLKSAVYGGSQSQWDAMLEENRIGAYNDPLLNATIICEGVDPTDDDMLTRVTSWEIRTTEEGRELNAVIYCGLETLGARVFCAVYDEDGRFLRMQEPAGAGDAGDAGDAGEPEEAQELTLTPGEITEMTYALDETIKKEGQVRLLIVDGENLPCCEKFVPRISEETPSEEPAEA